MSTERETSGPITSSDGATLHVESCGQGPRAVLLVHGWLGNVRWWDDTRDTLCPPRRVVTVDLAGHGASSRGRSRYTVDRYADDLVAVVRALSLEEVVLVGHSMSGAHVLVAAERLPEARAIVLVDTLKNLDARQPPAQIDAMLALYRADYPRAVREILPTYLFSPSTPRAVIERLTAEFLSVGGDEAAARLEPYLHFDPREVASRTRIPVRAIDGDLHVASEAVSRAYFQDFARRELAGCGHYPMLEQPEAFGIALRETLEALGA